jgi:hypothetical protein
MNLQAIIIMDKNVKFQVFNLKLDFSVPKDKPGEGLCIAKISYSNLIGEFGAKSSLTALPGRAIV